MSLDIDPQQRILGDPTDIAPILGPLNELEPIFGSESTRGTILRDEAQRDESPVAVVEDKEPQETHVKSRTSLLTAERMHEAARFMLAAGLFLVPVVLDPRTVDAFNLVKLTALLVLATLAGGLWVAGWILDRPSEPRLISSLYRSWIVRLSIVLLAVTSLATVFASTRGLAFFGLYHRFYGLISIALYVGVVLLTVALFRGRPALLRRLVAAIGAAAVLVSIYVVLQKLGVDFARWQQVSGSPPKLPIGNLGNASLTGSFLGISIPFVVYLSVTAAYWSRRFLWATGGIVVTFGLWFTQARTGILAAALGLAAAALLANRRARPWQKVAVVAAALLVLGLAPLAIPGIVGPRAPGRLDVVRVGEAAKQYRVDMWGASLRMAAERPALGWGPDTFYGNYARFRSSDEARTRGLAIPDSPQNIFLGWLTSAGFVGLIVYLSLVGAALLLLCRAIDKLGSVNRGLAVCFGAALVAYLVQGMYSVDVPPLALLGWIALAGIATLLSAQKDEPETPQDGEELVHTTAGARRVGSAARRVGPAAYAAIALVVIVVLTLGTRAVRADHAAWAAEARAPNGWSAETMHLYEKAISLNPFEAAYKGLGAFYLERVAGDQAAPFRFEQGLMRAARLYEDASALQPGNVYFMINAARVYERLGTTVHEKYFTHADQWLGSAATIDSFDPQIHELYASMLQKWSEKARSNVTRVETTRRAQTQAAVAQQLRAGLD